MARAGMSGGSSRPGGSSGGRSAGSGSARPGGSSGGRSMSGGSSRPGGSSGSRGMSGGSSYAGAGRAAAPGRPPASGAGRAPAPGRPAPRPTPPPPRPHPGPRVRPVHYRIPCPFGLMVSSVMTYEEVGLVLAALERLMYGTGRPNDMILVERFFGRRLAPIEYQDCYNWLRDYYGAW